ncbi:MAG: glycosyltransferase family 1 protein [Myxococcota bacterium]
MTTAVGIDLSVVGRGHFDPRGRTGLYRVTVELVRALVSNPALELVPFAGVLRGEAQAELDHLGVSLEVRRGRLERALFPLVYRWAQASQSRDVALTRSRRRVLRTVTDALEALPSRRAPRSVEAVSAVVHFPYDPPSAFGFEPGQGAIKLVTVHDLLPLTHPQYFGRDAGRLLRRVVRDVRAGAWAHCISHATRDALLELVPAAEERVFVAHLAAHPQRFYVPGQAAVRETVRRHDLGPYLLCLGTLDARKNLGLAFAVFEALASDHPELQLALVGAPSRQSDEWKRLSARYAAIASRVVRLGFVEDRELPALYRGARAFLFPSHAEGFGLPVLEALQCGAAVVSSDATSLPEVAGDAAVTVSPRDLEAWVDAVAGMLDSDRAAAWRRKGPPRAAAFTWEKTGEHLAAAYRRAASATA